MPPREFSFLPAPSGRPLDSLTQSNRQASQAQHSSVPTTNEDRCKIWEYIDQNEYDTRESLGALKETLDSRWEELDLKDWIRRERAKAEQSVFNETDKQIMALILESNRPWKNEHYLRSLAIVLQHNTGLSPTTDDIDEWMTKI